MNAFFISSGVGDVCGGGGGVSVGGSDAVKLRSYIFGACGFKPRSCPPSLVASGLRTLVAVIDASPYCDHSIHCRCVRRCHLGGSCTSHAADFLDAGDGSLHAGA